VYINVHKGNYVTPRTKAALFIPQGWGGMSGGGAGTGCSCFTICHVRVSILPITFEGTGEFSFNFA
jgi:hypothetical protein